MYKNIIYYLVEFNFLTYKQAVVWMHSECTDLDNRKPLDLIKEGRFAEVWQVVLKIANTS